MNIENAPASLFVDYQTGDLHLSTKASQAIDKGIQQQGATAKVDIDGSGVLSLGD